MDNDLLLFGTQLNCSILVEIDRFVRIIPPIQIEKTPEPEIIPGSGGWTGYLELFPLISRAFLFIDTCYLRRRGTTGTAFF